MLSKTDHDGVERAARSMLQGRAALDLADVAHADDTPASRFNQGRGGYGGRIDCRAIDPTHKRTIGRRGWGQPFLLLLLQQTWLLAARVGLGLAECVWARGSD